MPAAAAATPEIPAVPPVDPQDDYGDFLALLEDGSAPGEAPPGAPDAAPAPAKPAPAGEGDDLFAPPPAGAEPVVPAPAPAPSDKSLLDITTRLAALQEAENARRAEEAEARRRKEKEEADRLREAEEARPMFEGDLSLTPEESEAYRDAMPVLQKVARSVAEDMYRRAVMPLRKEIETLRLQSSGLQSTVQRSQAEGFAAACGAPCRIWISVLLTPRGRRIWQSL